MVENTDENTDENTESSSRYPPTHEGLYDCFKDLMQACEKAIRARHALLPPNVRADADAYLATMGLLYRMVARRAEDFENVWLELRYDDNNTAERIAWLEKVFSLNFAYEGKHLWGEEMAVECFHRQSDECKAAFARLWEGVPDSERETH